jgi:hypothetical protein
VAHCAALIDAGSMAVIEALFSARAIQVQDQTVLRCCNASVVQLTSCFHSYQAITVESVLSCCRVHKMLATNAGDSRDP